MILLVRFIGNVAAIWVASKLLDGVTYGGEWQNLLLAALVLTIANWLVKPFLTFLALPVIVLTLGIALFFVSLVMLLLTSWIVHGFQIDGFWTYVGVVVILWLVNWVAYTIIDELEAGRGRRVLA